MEKQNLDLEPWAIGLYLVIAVIILNGKLIALKEGRSFDPLPPQFLRSSQMNILTDTKTNTCSLSHKQNTTAKQSRMVNTERDALRFEKEYGVKVF